MKSIIVITILTLSACATNPDKIASSYISVNEYAGYSCQQLHSAEMRNERDAQALYKLMKSNSRVNATAGVVGALVFWPALFFMKGKNPIHDAEMAELNGRKTAIRIAMRNEGC